MAIPVAAVLSFGKALLDKFVRDPAQRDELKMQMTEAANQGKFQDLDFDFKIFGLEVEDKKSARQMAMTVGIMPQLILGSVITVGFFGMAWAVFAYDIPADKKDIVMFMFGVLATAWTGGVVGFFFGSSHGSKEKDKLSKAGD
jgi:hypothetical protein